MKSLISILTVLLFVLACNQSNKEFNILELPTISIRNEQFYASYCVYHLEETDSISIKNTKKMIASLLPDYRLVDSLSGNRNEYIVEWLTDPKNQYPAPEPDYLKHSGHGLSIEEMNKVQSPSSAIFIAFSGVNKNVIPDQIIINRIISSLTLNNHVVVTDYITFESFNSKSWNDDRVTAFNEANQDITSQFTIHLYRDQEFCRAVTLGLEKFCLPDISIQQISCNDQRSYANLINLISQTWVENPAIRVDSTLIIDIMSLKNDSVQKRLLNFKEQGASKRALITLSFVKPQEGDSYNAQFEVVFNNYSSKQEQQQTLISQVFGSNDEIQYIYHDIKVLQASNRAKKKLPDLKNMFNKGLEPGYSILLKAPFETDTGGREWMWIEVIQWNANSIKGILQNDPFKISKLSAGASVSVDPNDIFDYVLYLPDGTKEGNETGKIISEEN